MRLSFLGLVTSLLDCWGAFAVQMLLVLRTEVTRVFVLRLCALMHTATSELVNEEDWVPVATVERGASPYAISGLPLRFQDLLHSAMEHLTEYVVFGLLYFHPSRQLGILSLSSILCSDSTCLQTFILLVLGPSNSFPFLTMLLVSGCWRG